MKSAHNVDVKIGANIILAMDTHDLKSSSHIDENLSASSESFTDAEVQEISDDDDRNHKHRKREAQPHSFDDKSQEEPQRRAHRKRKTYDNGQISHDKQSTFERQRSTSMAKIRFPSDSGTSGRVNQAFHADRSPCFDISASIGHPFAGRGRGRNTVAWGQHGSRFNQLDSVDYTSQIASQGPSTHPGTFIGRGLPCAENMRTASWGAYGFIPGMASRILDPLHQISMQVLQPTITLMNAGLPCQRCRDFEEKGFCLLGDMCSMEHDINRIVVEDVQSLSQFNLRVATPNKHTVGVQAGSGSLLSTSTPASLMAGNKTVIEKDGMVADVLDTEGFSTAPGYVEADVYDPDQPLWVNECPETSNAHLRIPLPDTDEQHLVTDSSTGKGQHNGVQSENMTKIFLKDIGPQGNNSSVQEQSLRGNQLEMERISSTADSTGNVEFGTKENNTVSVFGTACASQEKHDDIKEFVSKKIGMQPLFRLVSSSGRTGGKISKASCTLYVRGIPQQINKRESLFSHFQKFGKVVHIHIPLNSEIAFVQFSKKEEAEAALRAPDAVMGNRFINLRWANRDCISGEEGGTLPKTFDQSSGKGELCLLSKGHGVEREEGDTSAALMRSRPPSLEAPLVVRGPGRDLLATSPKTTISVQKKMENLELLEEFRKKQEILAQKRDEFRRQLDKFEKQALSVKKAEHPSEQADNKHEGDRSHEATKPITPRKVNVGSTEAKNEDGKLQKSNSREVLISPTSKSTDVQNSTIMQTSHFLEPISSKFKQDNHPTTFRVLPPLPAGFAEVAVLKDYFSSYGDLSSVVLENPETGSGIEGGNPLEHQSACIAFQTRASAERAYLGGKCWQGHSLHFMWLPVPQSKSGLVIQEFSDSNGSLADENQAKNATCETSSLRVESSVNSCIIALATANGESTINVQVTSSVPSDAAMSHSKVSCTGSRCLNTQSYKEPYCTSGSPS